MKILEPNFERRNLVFKAYMREFNTINQFIDNDSHQGDYIIPLTGNPDEVFGENAIMIPENENYQNIGDPRLLRVYRYYDPSHKPLKNIKKFDQGKDSKGIMLKIQSLLDFLDSIISKIPKRILNSKISILESKYDQTFKDETTRKIVSNYIWIPVWNINSEKALVVDIRNRIFLIFS